MTKYYVESGSLFRFTILADSPVDAIMRALAATRDPLVELAEVIIVNQRGFVELREGQQMDGDEHIYPTDLLLGPPGDGDDHHLHWMN